MDTKVIIWTLCTKTSDGKYLQTVGTYESKAKAVAAMEAIRQPKTAVTRDGHTYVFQAANS